VGPLGVVVVKRDIEVGLECFDTLVEGLAHFDAEARVEYGAVEASDEGVGCGAFQPGPAGRDSVEFDFELVGWVSVPQASRPLSPE